MMAASLRSVPPIRREPTLGEVPADDGLRDRAIGHFIRQARGLSDLEIGEILAYQRTNGLRFGEAAIALKL
ncbi:MAG TPA: tyrosine protein kinase, partial [Burkholderiaceae bacterium]|nr:tyrosine protein kinase [Burkholderiaceae bacterium]